VDGRPNSPVRGRQGRRNTAEKANGAAPGTPGPTAAAGDAGTLALTHELPSGAPTGRSVEHGAYVANACIGCHRHDLSGGPFAATPAGCPQPANLTRLVADGYTEAELVRVFREGRAHDGHEINPFMPWRVLGGMSDDELLSLWDYLSQLEPLPTGT